MIFGTVIGLMANQGTYWFAYPQTGQWVAMLLAIPIGVITALGFWTLTDA